LTRNEPVGPPKVAPAVPSFDTDRSGQLADDPGGGVARVGADRDLGVDALLGVVDDGPAGAGDERVDPDDVALVLVGLDADAPAVLGRGVDDLVPGDRLAHVDAGLLDEGLAVPEHLGVGPERERDELAVPGGRVDRSAERLWRPVAVTAAVLDRVLQVVRDRGEEPGVGELSGVRRVDAHQVDAAVVRREPAGELDALLARVLREDLRRDRVAVGAAVLGDRGLAAAVGVDVPDELRPA